MFALLEGSGKSSRELERQVRRLTRALGPARELDVALENLRELEADPAVPRSALMRVRQALSAERRASQAGIRDAIDNTNLDKLRKRALRVAVASPTSSGGGSERLEDANRQAALRAKQLRAAMAHAAGIYLPDRLHDVRIAVKKLRYSLETVTELAGARPLPGSARLRKAQDLLGRMHDLEVLIGKTREVQGRPGAATLRKSAELDRLVRRLEDECRELHAQYISGRDVLLRVCDRAELGRAGKPRRRQARAR